VWEILTRERRKYSRVYAVMDGERIQEMRQARGLSPQEFAELAGIAVDAVASVERGEIVSGACGWRVAWALGVHPREIGRPATREEQLAFVRNNYAPYPEL
jgi:hypothetical protein